MLLLANDEYRQNCTMILITYSPVHRILRSILFIASYYAPWYNFGGELLEHDLGGTSAEFSQPLHM